MHALLKPMKQLPSEKSASRRNMEDYLVENPKLTRHLQRKILYTHRRQFDAQIGGQKSAIKFLDRDSVEYAMVMASSGDKTETNIAIKTLDNSLQLLDPIWGGVYQYSTNDWHHPHHSKTMSNQAGYMRIYALAYALWRDERYLNAATGIRDYLENFLLSDTGAFYCSQQNSNGCNKPDDYFSLPDHKRRKLGIPAVDKNIYTRENGWAIEALASLHEFSHDTKALSMALNATHWIIKNNSYPDGGFRHQQQEINGPHLADTLAMARAMLQLFKVTQQDKWLIRAINAADFISIYFKQRGGGYKSHVHFSADKIPEPQIDENISLMRFCNLLAHYSGLKRHRDMAKHCFRYLSVEEIATARDDEAGILLANHEYNEYPLNISLFGNKTLKQARILLTSGLEHFGWYKCIRVYQSLKIRPMDSIKPPTENPAVFVHDGYYESVAIRNSDELKKVLSQLS